ncbi:unnamed protein product [Lactuca virosa]|uniref:Uncharacterized protein n=1 Tax=Lactuca virosa TaxID=75947 RepID=A0AAU9LN08_9ASTR|nr:unnamed protein product [Lactuca virosa]
MICCKKIALAPILVENLNNKIYHDLHRPLYVVVQERKFTRIWFVIFKEFPQRFLKGISKPHRGGHF